MQGVVCSAIMHTRLCNPAHFASLNCYTQLLMSIWTLSNKVFCLSAPWKKHSDLSFSDDPKVYQMRGRERVEGEYWEKKRVRERERWKCKNKETKKWRSETDTPGSKDGFLAETSYCTESITTKLLTMHDYTRHLLATPSEEVFVTHLQNDPTCMPV